MKEPITKPVKLIVTHRNPDMDGIGATWLFMRFGGRLFEKVSYGFVQAGEEISRSELKEKGLTQAEVVHVDTGMGRFDHHQPDNERRDSATLRVYEYLIDTRPELENDTALARMVNFINETDHFASFYWPEPTDDRYLFTLEEIIAGLRSGRHFSNEEVLEFGMVCLDGVYTSFKIRVSAEEDLDELGSEFESPWGTALAIENKNDEVIKLAQKRGYDLVVRKDAAQGNVRIKAAPDKGIDLSGVYERVLEADKEGTWFFHPSKTMLLNGSEKSEQTPSPLTLKEVVEIVQEA